MDYAPAGGRARRKDGVAVWLEPSDDVRFDRGKSPTLFQGDRDEHIVQGAVEVQSELRAVIGEQVREASGRDLIELEPPKAVALVVSPLASDDHHEVVFQQVRITGRIERTEEDVAMSDVSLGGVVPRLDGPLVVWGLAGRADNILFRLNGTEGRRGVTVAGQGGDPVNSRVNADVRTVTVRESGIAGEVGQEHPVRRGTLGPIITWRGNLGAGMVRSR